MGLEFFPAGTKLYSGTELLPHNYDYASEPDGLQHYLKCTACDDIRSDSYEDHSAEGDFITDNPDYNYQEYHYQKCKCGLVMGILHTSDNGTETLAPDYDSEGKKEYRCSVCGYLLREETLAPLVHNVEEEWQSEASGHWHNCGCGERHNFGGHISDGGKVTLEPDYDSEGKKEYHCTVCGYLISEETLAPLGHNVEEEWQSDISGHWHSCGCGEMHNFGGHISDGGKVTLEPDYDSEGKKEYCCTVCGYVMKTETIPALGGGDTGRPNPPVNPDKPNIPSRPENPNEPDIPGEFDDPKTPDVSISPDYDKPFLKDDNGKKGWEAIKTNAENSEEGSAIIVDMNGTTVVPKEMFAVIEGKDITIIFEMGGGISWSVNGKSITEEALSDIDFAVNTDTVNIPAEIINNISKERYFIQISLLHSGEFGFTAVLSIDLGKDNAGLYAELYYYNNYDLKYICESEISSDGIAELTFTHASDYLILIDEKAVGDDKKTESGETYDPVSSDSNDKTPPSDDSDDSALTEENPKTGGAEEARKIMLFGSVSAAACLLLLKKGKKKIE